MVDLAAFEADIPSLVVKSVIPVLFCFSPAGHQQLIVFALR
jgi:hypothetical protein